MWSVHSWTQQPLLPKAGCELWLTTVPAAPYCLPPAGPSCHRKVSTLLFGSQGDTSMFLPLF